VVLIVHIEIYVFFVFGDVEIKFTIGLVVAVPAGFATKGTVFAIMLQLAKGHNFDRIGIQPPVEQVKMMGCFMHPEGTSFVDESMPAPEIICAVVYIEVPVEVYGGNLSDPLVDQEFLDLGDMGLWR
jgi:hypothetical protein